MSIEQIPVNGQQPAPVVKITVALMPNNAISVEGLSDNHLVNLGLLQFALTGAQQHMIRSQQGQRLSGPPLGGLPGLRG